MVVRDFFEAVYPEDHSNSDASDPNSYGISAKMSEEGRDRLVTAIEAVVDARNHLIHQWLTTFDAMSAQYCEELIIYLDEQNERLIPVYEEVAVLTESMRLARKEMVRQIDLELARSHDGDPADAKRGVGANCLEPSRVY